MIENHNPTPSEPHPLVVFGGSNSQDLASKIAKHLKIELGHAITRPFCNGESMVKINSNVRSRDVFVVQSLSRRWLPNENNPYSGVNDNFVELLLWIDALARASAWRITAVIPYFSYARQDRKTEGRTPISARVIATCLEEIGCDRVLAMDLHSEQIQGFFSRKTILDHLNAGMIISEHFNNMNLKNVTVLSPDVGNIKKADKYRQGMSSNYDFAVIDKRRHHDGSVEAKKLIGNVDGKTVILMDDIISTAGTMRSAIDLAIDNGAKEFYIAATHGEFVGKAVEKLNHPAVKEICVTDSISLLPQIKDELPINVLSISSLLAKAICRIHKGESLSELLGDFG